MQAALRPQESIVLIRLGKPIAPHQPVGVGFDLVRGHMGVFFDLKRPLYRISYCASLLPLKTIQQRHPLGWPEECGVSFPVGCSIAYAGVRAKGELAGRRTF